VRRVAPPKPPRHCASRQQVVLAPTLAKYRSSESTGTTHVLLPSVKGLRGDHCRDQSPTVTRERAGSVHSPRDRERHPASPRSASTRRSKVLERSRPSGPRYLALHRPFALFSTKPLMSLPDEPVIGARLDPGLDIRPPISDMPPDPVTGRPFSSVTPPIEREHSRLKSVYSRTVTIEACRC
jgi:hypothetical protein